MSARAARRAATAFVGVVFAVVLAMGCELIVPTDLPSYSCGADSPGACPTGMACDLATATCVSATTPADDGPGDDGPAVDGPEGGGKDTGPDAPGPLDLGQACRFDADCKSKLCGTSTILTTIFTQGTGPICTQTCCTSADCPSSFVCFSGGTGGSYCVPAAKAQRTPPATGGSAAGASCINPSECRSGLCSNSLCVDTCCVSGNCAPGTLCGVATLSAPPPAHDEWVCIASVVGLKNVGTTCADNIECKVNNCVGFGGATCTKCPACTPSCCSSADCTAWATAAQAPGGGTCAYGLSGSDQLKWCFPIDTARAPLGTTCGSNFDCQSSFCDPEFKKCMAVCCKDSDCGLGTTCKPSAVNTPFLRCVTGGR